MDELVWMAKTDLSCFEQALLPMGCGLRTYHAGDEWHWLYILRQANPQKSIKNAAFQQAFSAHAGELPRRLFFLVNSKGKDIGTATAWPDDIWQDASTGMLRKIVLLPEAQGVGLYAPFIRAVLARMRRSGCRRAYVRCVPAEAAMYASIGFQPLTHNPAEELAWEKIRLQLPWPHDMPFVPIAEKDWLSQDKKMA